MENGIIPRSKYALDVYLRIAELFSLGKSPDQIVEYLHEGYPSLKEARLSREFVKKAVKPTTAVLLPEMIRFVPSNGQWTLMIDGTFRSKDDNVLIVISAVPLENNDLTIIPLVAAFIPSENTNDVLQLFYDLKPRLSSMPKSIISDFRVGLLEAIATIFPNTISQGCHYHMLEMIAKIMIHPLIKGIQKKIHKPTKGLNRWAQHSIFGKQSQNLTLVAQSIKKLCSSNSGKFGENFLEFCNNFQELAKWAHQRKELLQSDHNYRDLVKLLTNKVWREIDPLLSQLEYVLKEFNRLRECLTMKEYKTARDDNLTKHGSDDLVLLDQLILDWKLLENVNEHNFHIRFKKSAVKLEKHYELITPASTDPSLPRTTSLLENLYSQIKHLLRRWSGTKQVARSFEWAAQLATISQSLKETDLFAQLLREVTSYEWIEQSLKLAKRASEYRFQIHFANSVASKSSLGIVRMIDNLAIRDITS